MTRMAIEFESRCRRSQTAWICCCSSSNITFDIPESPHPRSRARTRARSPIVNSLPGAIQLHLPTGFQCAGDGHTVGVFELAADGHAGGDAGGADAERFYDLGNIKGGGFAFDVRAGGDDQLVDLVWAGQAGHQLLQAQVVGSDTVE